MDFLEITRNRQSCRAYDPNRTVEEEKLSAVLEAAKLAPSACNGQPYKITVCTGENARAVALATRGVGGMNKFAVQAPVMIVLTIKRTLPSSGSVLLSYGIIPCRSSSRCRPGPGQGRWHPAYPPDSDSPESRSRTFRRWS